MAKNRTIAQIKLASSSARSEKRRITAGRRRKRTTSATHANPSTATPMSVFE
jgi:hypothetical protein